MIMMVNSNYLLYVTWIFNLFYLFVELTVGFETTEIIVSESSGEVMLCVNVTEPANELIELEFYLEANMYPGTAGMCRI